MNKRCDEILIIDENSQKIAGIRRRAIHRVCLEPKAARPGLWHTGLQMISAHRTDGATHGEIWAWIWKCYFEDLESLFVEFENPPSVEV